MRLAFLGTPDFALPTLAALMDAGHEVACVYAQPAAPRGRGQGVKPSPVAVLAAARGIALRTPLSLRAPEEIAAFTALQLDAAVVVAYGQILLQEVLQAPSLGCFNLHGSLLPRWRGAAPIQRAIMAGDEITGVQVMRMTVGLDEGPVLGGVTLRLDAQETFGTLHDRMAREGAALMVRVIAALARGEATETPQPAEGVSYARKIKPKDAQIEWDAPAAETDRRIRGLSPYPGAWFTLSSPRGAVRIKVLSSRVETGGGEAGRVLDDNLLIAGRTGAVRLLRLQREGRGAQDAAEFLRGFPVAAGTRLF